MLPDSLWAYYKTRNTERRNTEHPRNNGTIPEHGTPAERRNNTETRNNGTPEHGTPVERRNNAGITEHHRNNGTPPERWKQRNGTAEHYDRALAEERNFETAPMKK